ncbi:MAG: response regulator transcription factor [Flavobacteriales bacterium]|nr:response regulator transcription factor [Flavobacteriales bacterium]
MIDAVIIDDEKNSRNVLKRLIEELDTEISIIDEADGVIEGVKLINTVKPQLIFLDIEMLDGTGFNVLERVNEVDFKIIFTTAYDQYAIKAFKYSAIDYLLKPIDIDELEDAIYRAKDAIKNEDPQYNQISNLLTNIKISDSEKKVAIKSANKIDFVQIKDIICLKAESSYTVIYLLKNRKITASKPLKFYSSIFEDDTTFFRLDRTFLINVSYIKSYSKDKDTVELENGLELPIARRRRKEFLDLINF